MGVFTAQIAADMKRRPPHHTLYLSNYVQGDGTDEAVGVQRAFDDAQMNGLTLSCDVETPIGISRSVTMGATTPNSGQLTLVTIKGRLQLVALTSMESMVVQQGTVGWEGLELELNGADKATFGVYGQNCGRSRMGYLHAHNILASAFVVEPSGNNNLIALHRVRAWSCGSKLVTTATVASRSSESGWTGLGSTPTSSRWNLDTPLPAHMRSRSWTVCVAVMADGRIMPVTSLDTAAGSWVDIGHENKAVGASEQIVLYTAALNFPYYGDTGAFAINETDIRQCPNAATFSLGGYGGHIGSHTQQANALGIMIPIRAAGLHVGHCYTEGIPTLLFADHVNHATAGTQVWIGPGNKNGATIQIADQGWMTMTGRDKLPKHWQVVREYPDPAFVVPPIAPLDPPATQPGTKTLTAGTFQAYKHTSGAVTHRIDNSITGSLGRVTLMLPTTGSGMSVSVGLTSANGDTINGQAVASTSTYVPLGTYWGPTVVEYFRLAGGVDWVARIAETGPAASISGTPSMLGQRAIAGGVAYIATATTAASDWKQIT